MILKIYLIISIITLLLFILQLLSVIHITKSKFCMIGAGRRANIAGIIEQSVKMIILSFIPALNVFVLMSLIFAGEKIQSGVEKMIIDKRNKISE